MSTEAQKSNVHKRKLSFLHQELVDDFSGFGVGRLKNEKNEKNEKIKKSKNAIMERKQENE